MAFANGPKGLAQALSISGLSGVLGAPWLNSNKRSVIRKGLREFLPTRYSHIMSSGNDRCYRIEPFMFSGRYTYRPPKRPEDHLGSCANVIFIRNAGTNPKVMAVRSKVNVTERT